MLSKLWLIKKDIRYIAITIAVAKIQRKYKNVSFEVIQAIILISGTTYLWYIL